MARKYSNKKGKAGSTKPQNAKKPNWTSYKADEISAIISKLAKEGKPASQIGMILRDSYGIPDVKLLTGKSITTLLKDKKALPQIPEDLMALLKKDILIRKHLEENHKDVPAKRGLELTEAKIRNLVKYYKNTGRIAQDWKYDLENLRLIIE